MKPYERIPELVRLEAILAHREKERIAKVKRERIRRRRIRKKLKKKQRRERGEC